MLPQTATCRRRRFAHRDVQKRTAGSRGRSTREGEPGRTLEGDEAYLDPHDHRCDTVGRAELAHGVAKMEFDRLFGDGQDLPDFPIRLTFLAPLQTLHFLRCKAAGGDFLAGGVALEQKNGIAGLVVEGGNLCSANLEIAPTHEMSHTNSADKSTGNWSAPSKCPKSFFSGNNR